MGLAWAYPQTDTPLIKTSEVFVVFIKIFHAVPNYSFGV